MSGTSQKTEISSLHGGIVPGAIGFELRDQVGNHFALGSWIDIHYGDGTRRQTREIKAGGGFVSFDPPRAHFGLGEHTAVERVAVHWSTGETTELAGPFEAGHRYRITRRRTPVVTAESERRAPPHTAAR